MAAARTWSERFQQVFPEADFRVSLVSRTVSGALAETDPATREIRLHVDHPVDGVDFAVGHEGGHILQAMTGRDRAFATSEARELDATRIAGRFFRLTGSPRDKAIQLLSRHARGDASHGSAAQQVEAFCEGFDQPDGAWWTPYRDRFS